MIILHLTQDQMNALLQILTDKAAEQAIQDARDWVETQELERMALL